MFYRSPWYYEYLRSDRVIPALLVAGFMFAAVALGLVFAIGNPIVIGLAVGAFFGLILLSFLEVAVWLILVGTLVVAGPLIYEMPGLAKISWLFAMLGFFLAVIGMITGAMHRNDVARSAPPFVAVTIVFALYAILAQFFAEGGMLEALAGFKRYFQFWGLLLAIAYVPFSEKNVRRWCGFLLIVGLLQLPFALWQRLVLVPKLLNMPEIIPLDLVTGTLELSESGGGSSSVMVYLLLVFIAFVLSAYREKLLRADTFLLLLAILFAPLLLGETKVVIVMLPMVLWVVYSDLIRKKPVTFALGTATVLAALVGIMWIYLVIQVTDTKEMTLDQRMQNIIDYNFGNYGYNKKGGLNRWTVLTFWWQHHGLFNPLQTMFGHGMGSSYAGGGALVSGHVDLRYKGMSIGLTTASSLLWDMGVVGLLLYFSAIAMAWRNARQLLARAATGYERAIAHTLIASALLLGLLVFYSNSMVGLPSLQVLMSMTLGLIARNWRRG